MSELSVLKGDVRVTLKALPDNSVHCVVTSPPYWALRSYLPKDHPLKPLEIGSEPTPEAFIATMVEVFHEVRRVLHPSGTCWVNIGDSYCSTAPGTAMAGNSKTSTLDRNSRLDAQDNERAKNVRPQTPEGLKPKDLCLIPERLALALQADGWWVRSRICWAKKSPMPESVTDRPTSAWEHIWLLTKSARYFYDAAAVRQPQTGNAHSRGKGITPKTQKNGSYIKANESFHGSTSQWTEAEDSCANLRNFWLLGPEPYSEAHFATYPTEIPRRAILAGTSARGCCPKCLAPWERVVEREGYTESSSGNSHPTPFKGCTDKGSMAAGMTASGFVPNKSPITRTTGWRPTCECNAGDPQPCCVLDPFGGSGTTAAVAIELGRRAIVCELNPSYLELINQRCAVTPGLQLA